MAQPHLSWDKIITVYSPGGGTGKSEIAASLAYTLARQGKNVWIIDANVFAPSMDILYDVNVDNSTTFNEFILNKKLSKIPVCDISHITKCTKGGKLFLTPSIRDDADKRFQIEHVLIEDESACDKIPEAIFNSLGEGIDYLVVDTHPGFERINQVWLAITNYLLIISRITDVDLENLKMLLQERDVLDIKKKLVVFNNVTLNDERAAFKTMNNQKMQAKFLNLIQNPSQITAEQHDNASSVELFMHPIPYSEALALYPSDKGLYIQKNKLSNFALIIKALATKILEDLPTD